MENKDKMKQDHVLFHTNGLAKEIIWKNKKLFVKRFSFFAKNSELLYSLLKYPAIEDEVYAMMEIILFDNNCANFDCVVHQLHQLIDENQVVNMATDCEVNYTSLLLCKMMVAVSHHIHIEQRLVEKKINILQQYNNCFCEEYQYHPENLMTDRKFNYQPVLKNDFIDMIAVNEIQAAEFLELSRELFSKNGKINDNIQKSKSL